MSLLRYLLHRCECCGVRVSRGQGYASFTGFAYLCAECFECVRDVTDGVWIHRPPRQADARAAEPAPCACVVVSPEIIASGSIRVTCASCGKGYTYNDWLGRNEKGGGTEAKA